MLFNIFGSVSTDVSILSFYFKITLIWLASPKLFFKFASHNQFVFMKGVVGSGYGAVTFNWGRARGCRSYSFSLSVCIAPIEPPDVS